jgi:hypothetical protein
MVNCLDCKNVALNFPALLLIVPSQSGLLLPKICVWWSSHAALRYLVGVNNYILCGKDVGWKPCWLALRHLITLSKISHLGMVGFLA